MKKRNSGFSSSEEDRISNLPDSIIYHILSFIYTEDAAKFSVLSKRWRSIWKSLPVLNFCESCHCSESNDEDSLDERPSGAFIDFVDRVFRLHDDSDIPVIRFDCFSLHTSVSTIYKWIEIAVKHKVKELYIKAKVEDGFEIPPCLCTCESLTKMELQLTGWDEDNCENRIRLPLDMSFPRLELLHLRLEHISFRGDVNLTNRFFSSLPSLESLIMEMGHHGFHNTKLNISLPKLKYFVFDCQNDESDSGVKLHAPSLASFIFSSYLSTKFSPQCMSSLVTADIEIRVRREDKVVGSYDIRPEKKEAYAQHAMGFLRGIHSVKVLKFNHSFLKALGGAHYILDAQPLECYNLQHLELQTYLSRDCLHSVLYILKISPNLESLSLKISELNYDKPPVYPFCDEVNINPENMGDYLDAGLSLPCIISQLKFVEIKGLHGCVNELKFIEFLLKHATVLEKLVLACYSTEQDSLSEKRMRKVREKRMKKFREMLLTFPSASKNIRILWKF
ncbi:F-box/LRR-repeat protein At4g14103-like isoform X1 [Papaver somniferum]|uniref:F-box/LRR-repeat protein At4g14103-like isoform X1 n=1 Tax=Papaver somniferum TaxID=3469 RepID=UPI000E703CC5|nr:F-box/LRR-repeat protein At4g14103-like isoform X1 [Papaver somniferum]